MQYNFWYAKLGYKKLEQLHTIIYRSDALLENSEITKSIWNILSTSHKNNSRDSVTGLLVYDQDQFFQVIEGDRSRIEACYSRILSDPRHKNIETLIHTNSAIQTFYRWSMGFVDAYELDDYGPLCEGLRSAEPGDVFDSMAQIGCEHGLIQRATS